MYLYVPARICMYLHVNHMNCLNIMLVLLTHHHDFLGIKIDAGIAISAIQHQTTLS